MSSQPRFQEAPFFASVPETPPLAAATNAAVFAPSPAYPFGAAAPAFSASRPRPVEYQAPFNAAAQPSSGMSALLAAARPSGFARNPVFADGSAAHPADSEAVPPLQAAYDRGFAEGHRAASLQAEAQEAERRRADQAIELRFAQWDDATSHAVAERLRLTIMALCEEAVLPLALDMDGLMARIERAVALLQRATDERKVLLNPADFERLRHRLPQGITAEPHPSLEPGGLRIETADGGIEDGPSQWRQALAEAFHEC